MKLEKVTDFFDVGTEVFVENTITGFHLEQIGHFFERLTYDELHGLSEGNVVWLAPQITSPYDIIRFFRKVKIVKIMSEIGPLTFAWRTPSNQGITTVWDPHRTTYVFKVNEQELYKLVSNHPDAVRCS